MITTTNEKEEEYTFEIEMSSSIKLEERPLRLSLMSLCPYYGCREDDISYVCNYCGRVELKIYSGIIA